MRALKKIPASLALLLALAAPAFAQSNPGWSYGFVPTAAQWNAEWASKTDYLGSPPCVTSGCTMTGELITAASAASTAGFNLPPGTAPTSPVNGDTWTTASGFFARINGVTYNMISSAGSVNAGTAGQIGYYATSSNAISGSSAITISGGAATLASPIFTGTATGPDSGTWGSGGLNGSVIGATTPEVGHFTNTTATGTATVGTATVQSGFALTVNGTATVNIASTYYPVGYTSGTLTNGHCVSIGASGTLVDAGGACTTGGGGGTVSSGTAGQIAYYPSSGTTVGSTPAITIAGSVATLPSPTISGTATGPDAGTWGSGGINGSIVGATTPEAGHFTTLAASSTVSGSGFSTYLASPPAIGGTAAAAGTFTALTATSSFTATGLVTNADLAGSIAASKLIGTDIATVGTVTAGTWESAIGGTLSGNATLSGALTLSGTDNFTGTFEIGGNTMTFPGSPATLAALNVADQTLSGGTNVTSDNLGTISSGTTTIDCGARPLQYLTNGGAFTLAAPSHDGSCLIYVTNNGSAGTITLSGFSTNSPLGASYATTNGEIFALFIGRVNGTTVAVWSGPL